MAADVNTPILVGVGQITKPIHEDLNNAPSTSDLAASAAIHALNDALSAERLACQIDTIAVVRTFADTSPLWPCPFGSSNNIPRSIAHRIGADPAKAV